MWCLFAFIVPFRTEFCIRTPLALLLLKGPSFTLSIMFLYGPDRTELSVFYVFGSFPLDADGSSWVCCSSPPMSTSLPDLSPLHFSPPCNLVSSKLCTLGVGTVTFAEVTVFDAVCFFGEVLPRHNVLVLKGPLFALKSDFLSIEATCLLTHGALLSHSTFTKPNQYYAAWLISILGTSVFIT